MSRAHEACVHQVGHQHVARRVRDAQRGTRLEHQIRPANVHRRAVDPRVAGGDLDCADRVRRLERPHGHHQLATKAAGGRGVVWPECSPRRIARRTSRGSFMARNNIEIQGRDGDLLSALPRQKEIILRNYLFVHLEEVERKTFVKTKSKFDIAGHTKNMIAPTIRVLIAEDVAADAELEIRELKRAGLRVTPRIVDHPDDVVGDRLREREAGLRRAQVMAKLGHVITGADGVFESWSETLPPLIGVEPSQTPKSTREWLEMLHPDDRERLRSSSVEAAVKGSRVDVEYRLRRRDGAWMQHRQVVEPMPGQSVAAESERWFSTLQRSE